MMQDKEKTREQMIVELSRSRANYENLKREYDRVEVQLVKQSSHIRALQREIHTLKENQLTPDVIEQALVAVLDRRDAEINKANGVGN